MPTVNVECPECALVLPVEEDRLGDEMKCPKCKFVYEAEKSAGAYELADPAPRMRPNRQTADRPKFEPESRPETETERRLREQMEKWADDA